jgi:hypothetical protein
MTLDTTANTATAAGVSQFSDWTLVAAAAPTAAAASISGRVFSAQGRALSGAKVVLTDLSGNTRLARTNPFGYFQLLDIPSGSNYLVTIEHKQHRFMTEVINVGDDLTGLRFVALP